MTPCPACDRDTPDGLLCHHCVTRLKGSLAELPDLLAELEIQATRQAVTAEPGKRGAEEPLPFDWAASDQHWAVRNTLLTWVMELELGDLQGLADNPAAWCRWLAARIQRIRGHVDAPQIVDEISYCAEAARAAVDLPGDGLFCGTCEICGKALFAARDAAIVTCRHCAILGEDVVEYSVDERRQGMTAEAERRAVLTKREILDVAPAYRLPINSSTFSSWAHRGHLEPVDYRRGVPLYRLSDALTLARRARAEEASRTAEPGVVA